MKFLGSLIFVALINVLSVLAGPPKREYGSDSSFEYVLTYDNATIIRVLNTNSKQLVIKPFFNYNGKRYTVTSIDQGLATSNVETLIIDSSFPHAFYLGSTIGDAKNLKTIQVDAPNVTIGSATFQNVKRTITLKGKGLEKLALNYATDVLKSLNEKPTTYTSTTSTYTKQQHLYALARTLKNNGYLNYYSNCSNASNGIHSLLYKEGNMLGVARAFRIYALAKGFNAGDIKVASDSSYYNWNIVKLDNTWYNFDVIHTQFKAGQGDVSVFLNDNDYNQKFIKSFYGYTIPPSYWLVYLADYGYPNEVSGAETQNLYVWIENNRWNGVYHGHGRS